MDGELAAEKKSSSRHGRQCLSMEESALEMERKKREVRLIRQRILS